MPVQALKLDLDGVDPVVTGLRFTPRALFLYTTLATGDGTEYGTNTGGELGSFVSLSFAHEGGDGGFSVSRFVNPPVFIFGLGNIGCRRVSNSTGEVIDEGITVSSWDTCGFTLSGTFDNVRVGGLAFGSDDMEYAIGNVTLTNDGADATVSGLGFQPKLVMLIRQIDQGDQGEQSDIPPGLGVSNGGQHWFDGAYVPVTEVGGVTLSHDAWTQFFSTGCAILSDPFGTDPSRVYECVIDADGFTLQPIGGAASVPTGAPDTDYLYLVINDPVGDFNVGTLLTSGGTEEITGVSRPDALLLSQTNRGDGEEHSQELPAPPGFAAADGQLPFLRMGSSDRFAPAWFLTGIPSERITLALRLDEATGDGVNLVYSGGFGVLFTTVGGVLGTLIDAAVFALSIGDDLALICDGDDMSVELNGTVELSGTATDAPGPGRAAVQTDAIDAAYCGTIGSPALLDNFNRADNPDVNTDWTVWTTSPFVATANQSVGRNQMVGEIDQASYWNSSSFTDAELRVVVANIAIFDTEHNVWGLWGCGWSGFGHWAIRRMGGDPVDTFALWDQVDLGTYPTGPHLEVDVERASSWGVTTTGWRGDVTSDSGDHQVGWMLARLGPSSGSALCGFPPDRIGQPGQIYRRL